MQGIIIYKSTYGATRQVADWISEETGFPVRSVREIRPADIAQSDVVLIGSPVMAFQPLLKKWIIKKWPLLEGKHVGLFTTSGAPPSFGKLREGFEAGFPESIRSKLQYFPCGGRMIYSNLKPVHKLLMKIGQRIEKDPQLKVDMMKDTDQMNRDHIKPVIEMVKSLG